MPVNVRVDVPDFKAEVDLSCDLHGTSFWHLKLCLVDGLLSLHNDARTPEQAAPVADHEKKPLMRLMANTLKGRKQDNDNKSKSCMFAPTTRFSTTSIVSTVKKNQRRHNSALPSSRCHSSASSLSLSDKSTSSQPLDFLHANARSNGLISGRSQSQNEPPKSKETSQACYYGFGGASLTDWEGDNARQSNDLSDEEEDAAVKAIVMATANDACARYAGSDGMSTNGNYNESTSSTGSQPHDDSCDRRIRDLLELDEREECNDYEYLEFNSKLTEGKASCDRIEESDVKSTEAAAHLKLFEQLLRSGFLNYGASYYLDLEFKLKRRQQATLTLLKSSVYASSRGGTVNHTQRYEVGSGLSFNGSIRFYNDATSLKCSRPQNPSSLNDRTNESHTHQSVQSLQPTFTNNMIAKLATNNGSSSQKASSSQATASTSSSSSQSKRKRSKLLDLLLNTNWSKQSQQATNLMKLNKALLTCDANFLDEKTGESPLSLVITSPQINEIQATPKASRLRSIGNLANSASNGCTQSTSLFDLQCQQSTTSHNLLTLHQTSAVDISQSKAPLVERALLLLIKSGALIDFRNSDGRTPLHIAAKASNFWALKTLLDLEASPTAIDIDGLTPLFYSILHKAELKVTQLLLNHMNSDRNPSNPSFSNGQISNGSISASMEIVDQHGWQAVHYAAKYGLSGHLEKLLYYGCDINAKIRGSGNTPLHVAAINDQLQVAQVLLMRGADKEITNNSHQTAHQVAVISDNMNLAEFIANHDKSRVVPFESRPSLRQSDAIKTPAYAGNNAHRLSVSPSVQQIANLNSTQDSLAANNQQFAQQPNYIVRTDIVQSATQEQNVERKSMQSSYQRLNPLTLDVANDYASVFSSAPTTNTSGTSHQTAPSLLSIDSSHLQNNQANNISPSLSQRSCATSNTTTTSSSGVCCDGVDGAQQMDNASINSKGRNPNITIISIGNSAKEICDTSANKNPTSSHQSPQNLDDITGPVLSRFASGANNAVKSSQKFQNAGFSHQQEQASTKPFANELNEDLSGSESSSDELYSLMSDQKPLFVGSQVKATNSYESGDPKHLQLRRDDLVEVLEFPAELIRDGQLPRLANKPMLYGRRQSDGVCGLFPSFCVRRTKQKSNASGQPIQDITNLSRRHENLIAVQPNELPQAKTAIRGSNLPESQSLASMRAESLRHSFSTVDGKMVTQSDERRSSPLQPASFKEFQVTLTKVNEGFGFVLRGAKIDPSTISAQESGTNSAKLAIDERLMAANRLASLQYFSDIEPNSIAHQNGLKRGDFLISVNNNDVRMCSHEQVVRMIRQSGDEVYLTVARPAPLIAVSSKTLSRVKPEPPKRDPTTTLTRNKTMRVKSMFVAPLIQQQQSQLFDTNKPSSNVYNEMTPSPSGLNRSASTNLSHFNSVNSLASALDTQSISSISTLSSIQAPDSSSSTTTLTTVAANRPKVAPKVEGLHLKVSQAANNVSGDQTILQSASVTTISKQSEQGRNPNERNQSTTGAPNSINDQTGDIQMPPPPPPLPDFSNTPTKEYKTSRRTSAPINQPAPSIHMDKNQLIRKRASLAVVASEPGINATNGAAPICTVAAACAAAANNRLMRQQLRQQEQTNPELKSEVPKLAEAKQVGKVSSSQLHESDITPTNKPTRNGETVKQADQGSDLERTKGGETFDNDSTRKLFPVRGRETSNNLTAQSATLGRKSSAQIIQQPKHHSNISQSQTLKISSARQRMSILDYDSQIFAEPKKILDERAQLAQNYQTHNNHHRNHSHQNQQLPNKQYSHERTNTANRYSIDQLQDQHLLRQQHQQQLRQLQIQEQVRLQQQQQHRCQHGNHGINGNQSQVVNQQYMYQPQHTHWNQNINQYHDQVDNAMTMPVAQQCQRHPHADHHHKHTHHHHVQQHPQPVHHHQHQHQHQHQQQTQQHIHRQQLEASLMDQHGSIHQNPHHHYHQKRISQYQLQQQQYMQNVNVDPRLAAMNR